MLIARPRGDSFHVVDAFSRVVRLGEGIDENSALSSDAMDRTVQALSVCADRLRRHRVQRFRAIATEACRRAINQRDFIERVRSETGLLIDVIGAEEEARLAVAGCAPLADPASEHLLVFDIGGGSTELIWVDLTKATPARRRSLLMALAHGASRSARARAAASHVADWISLPVGVVTLGERFDGARCDAAVFDQMTTYVADQIAPFASKMRREIGADLSRLQVLGTSGTITTLAGVHLGLQRYSRQAVDGLWIEHAAVSQVIADLRAMPHRQRAAISCVGDDRATHLMSGAAILRAILSGWPTQQLRVADRGLREGMLYGLIQDARDDKQRGRGAPRPRR
ncbi:MAG: Ppx/GppA family phosphatase [Neomegalonema sp.]|nr:Ppx/GppA family phosphatase [Neomegalonema sp.]